MTQYKGHEYPGQLEELDFDPTEDLPDHDCNRCGGPCDCIFGEDDPCCLCDDCEEDEEF